MYRRIGQVVLLVVGLFCASCRAPQDEALDSVETATSSDRRYLDDTWLPLEPGPWGNLEYRRFFLPMPEAWLAGAPMTGATIWHVPGISPGETSTAINASLLTAKEKELWQQTCRLEPEGDGSVIHPSKEFRWALEPASRAKLYLWLAQFPQNPTLAFPFCYSTADSSDWMHESNLPPELLASIRQLIYPADSSLCFADLDLIEDKIVSREQRVELLGILYRHPYCDIRLHINVTTDLSALSHYWGEAYRAEKVKRTLQAALGKKTEAYISLTQLFPSLPRTLVNTYPAVTTNRAKPQPDCYWTTFNFFNIKPDDRFFDNAFMEEALTKHHERVQGKARYGDILFLVDSTGRPFHSAIYLAADFVFTKNGGHFTQPWVIMKLTDLKACYPQARPVREAYYRWSPVNSRPASS